MKINPDCIRDVMLLLEKHLSIQYVEMNGNTYYVFKTINAEQLAKAMTNYTDADVLYSVLQLIADGHIVTRKTRDIKEWSKRVELG